MLNATGCQYSITKWRICYWAVGNKNISLLMNTFLFQCQPFNDAGLQIATMAPDRGGFQFTAPFNAFTAIQHAWCWQQHYLLFCKGVKIGVSTSAKVTNWKCSCQVKYKDLRGKVKWRPEKLHNEELHNFCSSPCIFRMIKQWGLKVWACSMNWGDKICRGEG